LKKLLKDPEFLIALILGPLVSLCFGILTSSTIKFSLSLSLKFYLIQFFLVAVPEEVAFRGILMEILLNKFKKNWGKLSFANLVASIAFAMCHAFYHPFWFAVLTFFPGLVFGYFREKYDSVLPSIILHFFYNVCFNTFT